MVKIVNILWTIDKKLELNNQINNKLEETAKAITMNGLLILTSPMKMDYPIKTTVENFMRLNWVKFQLDGKLIIYIQYPMLFMDFHLNQNNLMKKD